MTDTNTTPWAQIEAWLDLNADNLIRRDFRTPANPNWIVGIPWDDNTFNPDNIDNLKIEDNVITFTYRIYSCNWTAEPYPEDRFGNLYLEGGEIRLVKGCFEIGYSDTSYSEFNLSNLNIEDGEEFEFLDWCVENTELVGILTYKEISNNTACETTFWTSTLDPDSREWEQILEQYWKDKFWPESDSDT